MNFELTPLHKTIRKITRKFAEERLKPVASAMDEKGEFPRELLREAAEIKLVGIDIPKKYGGAEADTIAYCIVEEELARIWGSFGLDVSAGNSLSIKPILLNGTEEQREEYVPALVKYDILGCYALTEPEAGSDAASIKTKAVLDGNEWVINGEKYLITIGNVADLCVLIARTSEERHKGISAFIFPTETAGFSAEKIEKMGLFSSPTAHLFFDSCRIPKENLLGQIGGGWGIAMQTLNGGRINIAAQAIGLAQGAYEIALEYSKERKQFGKPIAEFQDVQFRLVEMDINIQAARLLTYEAAWRKDNNLSFIKEASRAKVFASEMAKRVTNEAVEILAGFGYTRDGVVERHFRDAVATPIYEGANPIQKIIIAREILGTNK